jgi:hypothetical protein
MGDGDKLSRSGGAVNEIKKLLSLNVGLDQN